MTTGLCVLREPWVVLSPASRGLHLAPWLPVAVVWTLPQMQPTWPGPVAGAHTRVHATHTVSSEPVWAVSLSKGGKKRQGIQGAHPAQPHWDSGQGTGASSVVSVLTQWTSELDAGLGSISSAAAVYHIFVSTAHPASV